MAVPCLEQPFARAVFRYEPLDGFRPPDGEMFGEERAMGLGNVAHIGKIRRAAMIDLMPELLCAEFGLFFREPGGFERGPDFLSSEPDKRNLPVLARRTVARQGNGIGVARAIHWCRG